MTAALIRSITDNAGQPTDPDAIRDRIGFWTWAYMGTTEADITRRGDGLQARILTNRGRSTRTLTIKLTLRGLYDVEIGRADRRTRAYIPLAQTLDIHPTDLADSVRDAYDAIT